MSRGRCITWTYMRVRVLEAISCVGMEMRSRILSGHNGMFKLARRSRAFPLGLRWNSTRSNGNGTVSLSGVFSSLIRNLIFDYLRSRSSWLPSFELISCCFMELVTMESVRSTWSQTLVRFIIPGLSCLRSVTPISSISIGGSHFLFRKHEAKVLFCYRRRCTITAGTGDRHQGFHWLRTLQLISRDGDASSPSRWEMRDMNPLF